MSIIDRLVVEITLSDWSMGKITFIKGLVVKIPLIDELVVKLSRFVWYILDYSHRSVGGLLTLIGWR